MMCDMTNLSYKVVKLLLNYFPVPVYISGGNMTLEDLRSFKVQVLDAWKVTLGDYDMYFPPPPAGGAVVSFILNTMRGEQPHCLQHKRLHSVLPTTYAHTHSTHRRHPQTCSTSLTGKKTIDFELLRNSRLVRYRFSLGRVQSSSRRPANKPTHLDVW